MIAKQFKKGMTGIIIGISCITALHMAISMDNQFAYNCMVFVMPALACLSIFTYGFGLAHPDIRFSKEKQWNRPFILILDIVALLLILSDCWYFVGTLWFIGMLFGVAKYHQDMESLEKGKADE